MTATTGTFGSLIYPGLRKVFFAPENYKDPSDSIVMAGGKVENMTQREEADLAVNGIAYLTAKSESAPITYQDASEGYKTIYAANAFAAGMSVTREEYKDNLYMKKGMRESASLGKAARITPVRDFFSMLNNAQNTAYTSYGDGKPLCSISHTSSTGGSSMSNADADGLVLSADNLNTLLIQLRKQVDDKGIPVAVGEGRVKLVVPPDLEKLARELAETDSKPDTAENGINYYKGIVDVVSSRWMASDVGGSATRWFLIDPQVSQLQLLWRDKVVFEQDDEFDTKIAKFSAWARWAKGWSDFRGVVCSAGDSQNYAS